MSLLKLSNIQDSEWYIPLNNLYPHGKRGYLTKQFSPRQKTMRKCQELAFYTQELPIIVSDNYNVKKFFDKKYIYSQIINIVIQKNPKNALHKNSFRRTAGLL